MNKKRILILIMSSKDDFFQNQQEIIKKTWLNKVKNHDNIDYLIYYGDGNLTKHSYNKEEHILKLRCEDDINNSFKKTYYAFNLLEKIFKNYDYVFRTNTSTYVNIDLLNEFIHYLADDNILWTSDLYSLSNSFCPYPLYLYGRGNGLVLSKKLINIILKEGKSFLYYSKPDDETIGNILNSYWIKYDKNYLDYIKGYAHGWYKCVNVKQPNNHKLCIYGNDNKDWDYIKNFLTIQIKQYNRNREEENKSYDELYKVFSNNEYDDLEKSLKYSFDYSNEPSIFIGSNLGYLDYSVWKTYNKNELFILENNHKAFDDKNNILEKWL